MTLSPELTDQILSYLGCEKQAPSVRYLNQLVRAYTRRVPWESVSRIVKRQTTPDTAACPRWPAEFWQGAFTSGTGGTCFESNLAFFTLLNALGFDGYLTINDMEHPACHTASIILLNGQKYLADVGIPLHCALPFKSAHLARRASDFHHYTIRPQANSRYAIERSHHPKREIFTLVDIPVSPEAYAAAVQQDYEETGYFLDRVIMVKVIAGRIWRFSSTEMPYRLEGFDKTSRQEVRLEKPDLAASLAEHFEMDEEMIAAALAYRQVV